MDFKKYRLDLFIILGFALLSLLYCYPQLQGKKLKSSDSVMWQAMVHEAQSYHDSTGKDVLWSNSMFSGMPTYTTYIGANTYNYPAYIQDFLKIVGKPAYFFFIAMLCFYLLMQVLGVNRWLSIVGAIAYAFASYNSIIIGVGHDTKMLSIGYMPAALAGLYLIYKEKWLTGAALFSMAMALTACNSHYQMIYYFLIVFICFGVGMLFVAIKEGKLKQFFIATAISIVCGVVSMMPTVTLISTTNEYAKETMRGGASELSGHDKKSTGGLDKEYAFRWSMGIGETFCVMIPYLYGGATVEPAEKAPKTAEMVGANADMLPIYWGAQPTQMGPVYLGAVVCFLFVLGLLVVRSAHKWWIVAACIIGIILSWGKNLPGINYLLFDTIPYLNKFRTVEMAMVIPQFLFPLLGIWGLNEVIEGNYDKAKLWKNVRIAAGITAGLCILLGVGGSMFFDFTNPAADSRYQPELLKALKEDRASLAMTSALKSAVYIIIAGGLLWAFIKNMIKPVVLIAGMGLIVAIDLIPVAQSYLNEKYYADATEMENEYEPRDVDKAIMQDRDPYYRVLDLSRDPYNDAIQAYFHKCVGGYHPAKMEMYQDLIDRQMGNKGFNREVLNMLNTKYIIVGGQKSAPQVLPNSTALGNAWFIDEVKWAATADEEMNALNAPSLGDTVNMPNAFNPRKTAVIRSTFKDNFGTYAFGKDSSAFVKLTQYGLDELSFASRNSKDGLAVFSDIYYAAGWKAYVDGKETPIYKANYVLRAIKIPAGQHKIEFEFKPRTFYEARKIAMAGCVLLFGLCAFALVPLFKKKEGAAK